MTASLRRRIRICGISFSLEEDCCNTTAGVTPQYRRSTASTTTTASWILWEARSTRGPTLSALYLSTHRARRSPEQLGYKFPTASSERNRENEIGSTGPCRSFGFHKFDKC